MEGREDYAAEKNQGNLYKNKGRYSFPFSSGVAFRNITSCNIVACVQQFVDRQLQESYVPNSLCNEQHWENDKNNILFFIWS